MKNYYAHDPFRLWYFPMLLGLIFLGPGVGILATPVEFYVSRLWQSFGRLASGSSKTTAKIFIKR